MNQTAFLSLKEIKTDTVNDPLGNFYSGIKSEETKKSYRKTLREFLFAIKEFTGTFEQKANQFAEFGVKNPDEMKSLLKNYAKHLRERTEKPTTDVTYLNPNTLPNKFKSIKKFLKMNEIPMEWGGIEAIFPEQNNIKQTRGYTTEELRKILDYYKDPTSQFLILAESSSGMRVGDLESQKWSNINPIYASIEGEFTHDKSKSGGKIICASMIVYEGTSSRYIELISIEAWEKLQTLREFWIMKMKKEPKPDDPIFITKTGELFKKGGIISKVTKIVEASGIQSPLTEGQRNHDVPMTHGMRKRWNKVMSEKNINGDSYGNLIRKERLFGHTISVTTLDNSYFHSTIKKSVSQYLEAMPDLMISNEFRQLKIVNEFQEKNKKLEEKLMEKDTALTVVRELQAKVERMTKYEKTSL